MQLWMGQMKRGDRDKMEHGVHRVKWKVQVGGKQMEVTR